MKNWIIAALVAVVATGGALSALAATQTVNQTFEIRVWEDVNDPEANYISARPEGGNWRTLGTISIPLTDGVSSSGRFRYGDIKLEVPVTVEVPDPPEPESGSSATPGGTVNGPFEGSGDGYHTWSDAFTDATNTFIYSAFEGQYDWDDDTWLVIRCANAELDVYLSGGDVPISDINDQYQVTWRAGRQPAVEETWNAGQDYDTAFAAAPGSFYRSIKEETGVVIRLVGFSQTETMTFDLSETFSSPVQWNIDNCGSY